MGSFHLQIVIICNIFSLLAATGHVTNIGDETSSSSTSSSSTSSLNDIGQQNHDSNKKQRGLQMSKIARDHLSDEKNPNNFPKLLGIEFPGEYFLPRQQPTVYCWLVSFYMGRSVAKFENLCISSN